MAEIVIYTYQNIKEMLDNAKQEIDLPGIDSYPEEHTFIKQILDSTKRIQYLKIIQDRGCSISRANPYTNGFNPLMGAVALLNENNYDEACWLVFLYVLFGKDKRGYGLLKSFYNRLGDENSLHSYHYVVQNLDEVGEWIEVNRAALKANGNFGNHRKYESLKNSPKGIINTIRSYIELMHLGHEEYFESIINIVGNDRFKLFDYLYKDFSKIFRYGRLSIFDHLTMLGKLNIIEIEPASCYIKDATGPKDGLKDLLNLQNIDNKTLEQVSIIISNHLKLPFKMQILEDALCNWQKSKTVYIRFKA